MCRYFIPIKYQARNSWTHGCLKTLFKKPSLCAYLKHQSNERCNALTWLIATEPSSAHPMNASADTRQQMLNSVPRMSAHMTSPVELPFVQTPMPAVSSVLWSNMPLELFLCLELTLCPEPTEYLLAALFQNISLCMFICYAILPSINPSAHLCMCT